MRTPLPWATGLVVALAVGLYFVPEAEARLALDRASTLRGELWRLWTCHLVHFGASHLLWDIVVVAMVGTVVERAAPVRTKLLYLIAPPAVALALLAGAPAMTTYAGLSGIAMALTAFLAVDRWRAAVGRAQRRIWVGLLGLLLIKLTLDVVGVRGSPIRFSDPAVLPMPLAHVAGFVCGVVGALVRRR